MKPEEKHLTDLSKRYNINVSGQAIGLPIIFYQEFYMDSLIFSLNATIPVFLVIVLGYILMRVGFLRKGS